MAMHDDEHENKRRFYAVSHDNDQASLDKGSLIPGSVREGKELKILSLDLPDMPFQRIGAALLTAFSLAVLLLFFSSVGYATLSSLNSNTNPAVVIENPYTQEVTPFNYGVEVALAQLSFHEETRNAFIAEEQTFIEADFSDRMVRYFENGVLLFSTPIISTGERGTVCEVSPGLYEVDAISERPYSQFARAFLPWRVSFAGNYAIHGWPETESGDLVENSFGADCIRIDTAKAEQLSTYVEAGINVLVHKDQIEKEDFLYEPKISELDTPHYLIADVDTSTVLASSDLDAVTPIASITKLMTALIATEEIDLNQTVWVTQPTFVQSLVPRLGERNQASMYSLLQLLLVESSNEAAEVIAAQVGQEEFIELMNEKATALGLTQTQFADASGLSSDNLSSIGDLLRLTQYIYEHRSFIFAVTAEQDAASNYVSDDFGELTNFNTIAGLESFVGGKVGETLAAGQTSVTLHEVVIKGETRTLAIILLGSEARNEDVTTLLQYAKERFGG
ncbi:MAG: L,D-transpeptidase family protein [Patescibacteria group bacterium]